VKSIINDWQERLFLFLFFAFLATALIGPIASTTAIPDLADYINHLGAIIQAKMALIEGQFPLRITPAEQSGWRYPFYQFYSPSTYTFAGTLYWLLTPHNPLLAYKITIWIALVAAGLFMYQLTHWLTKSKPAAILASVVYLTSPYYIIVVNRLGSLGETIALAIVPAVVYYTLQRYFHPTKDKTLLQTSLVWYLLITTHLVTFVYTSLMMGILVLLITLQNRHHWRNLIHTGIAYLLACMLACWYLAPIAFLAKYFLLSDTYNTTAHINYFHPLLSYLVSPSALISTEYRNALFKLHPGIGWPILFAFGLSVYAYCKKIKSHNQRADYLLPSFLILFAIAFLMAWSPFDFWRWLPKPLLIAQYSWRLLSQVSWIGAVLFAWAITALYQKRLDLSHVCIGVFIICMSASQWMPGIKYSTIDVAAFIKNPTFVYNHNAYSINFAKYTQFVTQIDSMLIEPDSKLKTKSPYILHRELLNIADKPYISLEGTVTEKSPSHQQLTALLNNTEIGTTALVSGKLQWNIPLPPATSLAENKPIQLQFQVEDKDNKRKLVTADNITLDKLLLSGFLKPSETLNVEQIKSSCHLEKSDTVCDIKVPVSTTLIELPILYYPKLLSITLNGKPTMAQGVMYQGYLLAGVIPKAGEINHIRINFQGLDWANQISRLGWGLWLFVFMALWYRKLKQAKETS
jgi:hypothetical protein